MDRLYYEADIQKMMDFLSSNKEAETALYKAIDKRYMDNIDYCKDCQALKECIGQHDAEAFYRYDSAVGDQFIYITESVFGRSWHVNGIQFPSTEHKEETK